MTSPTMQRHVRNRHQGIVGWIAWDVRSFFLPNFSALSIARAIVGCIKARKWAGRIAAILTVPHAVARITALARATTKGPIEASACDSGTHDLGQHRGLWRRGLTVLV